MKRYVASALGCKFVLNLFARSSNRPSRTTFWFLILVTFDSWAPIKYQLIPLARYNCPIAPRVCASSFFLSTFAFAFVAPAECKPRCLTVADSRTNEKTYINASDANVCELLYTYRRPDWRKINKTTS